MNIYGQGPYGQHLQAMTDKLGISAAVSFEGLVSHEELPDRLREHDVFVLPSYREGLSLALLEALASGLSCVVTHTANDNGFLRQDVDALLVDTGDSDALRDALLRLAAEGRSPGEEHHWSNGMGQVSYPDGAGCRCILNK